MPRLFSTGARTSAGSTTLPVISLYSGASGGGNILEIGVSNTTATAVSLKLVELTSTGTQGTALAETHWGYGGATPNCAAFNTHTVAPALGGDLGMHVTLGAAIGADKVWKFPGNGISTGGSGTGNGIGVIVATGTGQVLDAHIVWSEDS
jgi:hypothetical protein